MSGWQCPACGAGNAPWVAQCPCTTLKPKDRCRVWRYGQQCMLDEGHSSVLHAFTRDERMT